MFYSLQKIVLDNFPRNCLIWSSRGFISGLQDFTPYFHFRSFKTPEHKTVAKREMIWTPKEVVRRATRRENDQTNLDEAEFILSILWKKKWKWL